MIADPTFTINSIAQVLKRTGMDRNSGTFRTNDGSHSLTISHNLGNVNQRMIRLDRVQTVANPLTTGEFLEVSDSVWLVSRTPKVGYLSVAVQRQLTDGFLTGLQASSGALLNSLLGGES
nr:MAG: hypothetical protein 2 [Leviviridae sp.]